MHVAIAGAFRDMFVKYDFCGSFKMLFFMLHLCATSLRISLVECERFGSKDLSLQDRLDEAFKCFKGFCKSRKIQCSQPPFTVKMVFWLQCSFTIWFLFA